MNGIGKSGGLFKLGNDYMGLIKCTDHTCNCTYLLTPWCRVLLEKLTGLQLVKKFPAFHETRMFITALTSVRHLSLSWASPIQSIYPHPTSRRSVRILFTHLRLGLPSGLFPSGFPTKTLYTPSPHPYAQRDLIWPNYLQIWVKSLLLGRTDCTHSKFYFLVYFVIPLYISQNKLFVLLTH